MIGGEKQKLGKAKRKKMEWKAKKKGVSDETEAQGREGKGDKGPRCTAWPAGSPL